MDLATTRAADGLPRRAFTTADVRRMIDAEVLSENERFELIEGDIVIRRPNVMAHESIKNALGMAMLRAPQHPDLIIGIATTLQLTSATLVDPDVAVVSRRIFQDTGSYFARLQPGDARLIVEIAASDLGYDKIIKARLYARHGIREFWVIDANERVTWIHTGPSGDTWSSIVERGPNETLTAAALPGFAIRLADI
jgi:Uma2 family endonuclease